jgi:hypothetical protein
MSKSIALFFVLSFASATPTSARIVAPQAEHTETTSSAQECCKICHKGKACGNSCISRDKSCHQPPGCACDD